MGVKQTLGRQLAGPARAYVRHAPTSVGKRLLVRRLLEPALRGAPRSFVAPTIDGLLLRGSTQDMIQRYVYVFGVWEPDVTAWMRRRLEPGRTLIDVGANIGYFTLLGSGLVGPTGSVVAVEALPSTFEELQANVALNAARNVRALNVAATAEPCVVTLYNPESHNSGTTTTIAADGLTPLAEIDGAPLATLLTADEIAAARVIKIDVEGAELDVLRGLEPALPDLASDAELIVEVSPDGPGAGRGETPLDLLTRHGFFAYRITNDYRLVSYVDPVPGPPPQRFHGPITERMDLVFSRTDADELP